MEKANRALAFLVMVALGMACGGSAPPVDDGGPNGRRGPGALGGATASAGGSGAGGQIGAGGVGGTRGSRDAAAGGGAGGAGGTGGSASDGGGVPGHGGAGLGGSQAGGRDGSGTGGSAAGGSSGTCPAVLCPAIGCPYGQIPNPDPCGCPICASPDAGVKDSAPDGPCPALPCAYPLCPAGSVVVTPPCGCPTCVPVDAGPPDGACPPIDCPAIACSGKIVPNPNPCGCPLCQPTDAGAEAAVPACASLDECGCFQAKGCSALAESCYCPYPQCGAGGACICGGGKYVACVPAQLSTCAQAKARIATLCPQITGAIFDGLCSQTNTICITKCLDEVTACSDVACSFCEACDCAADPYTACVAKCASTLAQ